MDKLNYLKSTSQKARDYVKVSRSFRQPTFKDRVNYKGYITRPFKHDWALMTQMHDLRLWTLAYAPSRTNNLQRIQELHLLNNEMWYLTFNSMWKRAFLFVIIWFFITRVFKSKFLNQGNFDSHDTVWRDNGSTM